MERGSFSYTPFAFDESPAQSYFGEALGVSMSTPTPGDNALLSPAFMQDNKNEPRDYFNTIHYTTMCLPYSSFERYGSSETMKDVDGSQVPSQNAGEDKPYLQAIPQLAQNSATICKTTSPPSLLIQAEESDALDQGTQRKRKSNYKIPEDRDKTKKIKIENHQTNQPAHKIRSRNPRIHATIAEKDAAHAHFLARNRAAASKSRGNERAGTAKQEKAFNDLLIRNMELRAEFNGLVLEIQGLGKSVMEHVG